MNVDPEDSFVEVDPRCAPHWVAFESRATMTEYLPSEKFQRSRRIWTQLTSNSRTPFFQDSSTNGGVASLHDLSLSTHLILFREIKVSAV